MNDCSALSEGTSLQVPEEMSPTGHTLPCSKYHQHDRESKNVR